MKTFWLVDPPPDSIRAKERHKWALFPEGREASFEVHVLDRAENVLARAMAPTRGLVELGFINRERELTLQVVRGGAPNAQPRVTDRKEQLAALGRPANSRMKVVQTALTQTATIDISGTVVQLLSAPHDRGHGLVVVQQDRMSVYDVTTPSAPVLVDELQGEGFAGAAHAEDGTLLTWGAGGCNACPWIAADSHDSSGISTPPRRPDPHGPRLGVAVGRPPGLSRFQSGRARADGASEPGGRAPVFGEAAGDARLR